MKRGLLLYNPTAGQRDRLSQMQEIAGRMRARGIELVHAPTERVGHATEIVREHVRRGIDVVAACGGDGTISEAACGLAGSAIPLAALPGGTSNVLIRELGIPLDLARAADLICDGVPRSVRLLEANGRPFLLWAGVGLDARIMGKMNLRLKRWLGRAGIFLTVAPEFFRYEFPRLEVVIDGVSHEATFAVVSHARRYAGDWIIAPDAALDSDEMSVLLYAGRDRWRFFRLFRLMQLGKSEHLSRKIASVVRGREVVVRSLAGYPVEVELDGDCILQTPITCRPAPSSVSILVPAEPQKA